ncbi:MAG: hypothetical protein ACRCW9_08665 [Cetobacterium sp.]
MCFEVIQWNARSLLANGQEFKKYIEDLQQKPKVICIQETWLKPHLDFKIQGYEGIRKDREIGTGGGIVTFIEQGVRFREISNNEKEAIIVEIWTDQNSFKMINFYNPCKRLKKEKLEELLKLSGDKVVW